MSNKVEEIDLTSPEFVPTLTAEQIAAAGERKKYLDNTVYYMRTTAAKINYSKPLLKNGELNADAKGSIWLELELTPLRKDGSISTKLKPVNYVRVFFYERLNTQAMQRVGYTAEQIAKVQDMTLPDTYEMFRSFARAAFPERFETYPRFDKETKTWSHNGAQITEAQAADIKAAEKVKVIAFQKEVRGNPKLVQGKSAFWQVGYEKDKGTKEKSAFVSAKWASSTPHRKDGVELPVADPDRDFA